MSTIKISIIIPVYNVEEYLADCLDSVLQQDFENYEIICVDDASTDRSGEILQEYASKYEKVKIFKHTYNKGLSGTRNTGMSQATGKYIWFVDSDDMIVEGSLAALYDIAEQNNTDIVYFNRQILYEGVKTCRKEVSVLACGGSGIYSGMEQFCNYVENSEWKVEAWRQFIRIDIVKENKIWFYDNIFYEDTLFSFLCAMKARRVIDIQREYYIYRKRKGSITKQKNYRCAQSMFVILVQIIAYWISHEFSDREHKAVGIYVQNIYKLYQYYRCFGEAAELEVGGKAEKLLYSLLKEDKGSVWLSIGEQQVAQLKKASRVMIFGAGRGAADINRALQKNGIQVERFIVSDLEGNPETFCGKEVCSIEMLTPDMRDAAIIIGVTKKYSMGIKDKLVQLGFKNIVMTEDVFKE